MIAPMLLQPFIENAIWHGLMQKRAKGTITVDIRIEIMNKLNSTGAQVHIIDLKDEQGIASGSRVELIIPV